MIYINNETSEVVIPKYSVSSPYKLKIKSNLTNKEYIFNVTDKTPNNIYYTFDISLNIETGEYNYYVLDENDIILAVGLLQYGEYVREKTEYDKNNEIIVYNG